MNERLIRVAAGKEPADLIIKNSQVFHVFTGEVIKTDVAIADGRIAALGNYSDAAEVLELSGRYLVPGFINAHCHVESSMVTPPCYCAEELRHGVTTLITDPHEVANVAGISGIRYMLESTKALPINYYVQLPSCVPSTPFEHAGAVLSAKDLAPLLQESRVLGLGEMMDYPGVINCQPDTLEKLIMARGRVIDGHAPNLTGRELCAYIAAGICNDHESTTFAEALEKLRLGQAVLVREGSASRNLEAIVSGIIQLGISPALPPSVPTTSIWPTCAGKAASATVCAKYRLGLALVKPTVWQPSMRLKSSGFSIWEPSLPDTAPIWWCWTIWKKSRFWLFIRTELSSTRITWRPMLGLTLFLSR